MQTMSIHVKKFYGHYDASTRCLTVDIAKGSVLQTEVDETKLKVELIFDPETTWLMGEMVDTLKKRSQNGFGSEPGLLSSPD